MKEIRKLLKCFKGSRYIIILALFFSILFVTTTLLIPFYSGKAIDAIDNFSSFNDFVYYIYILVILVVLAVVFNYLFELFISLFTERVMKRLKDNLYSKINSVSIKFIDNHRHGDLLSRVTNDVDNIYNAIISSFKQLFDGVITVIITIIIMFYMNYILALVVMILTPFALLMSYLVAKNSNKYFKKQGLLNGSIGSLFLEDISNIESIKSLNYGDDAYINFAAVNNELYKVGQKAQFISTFTNPTTRLINNSTYAIVGVVGALLVVFGSNTFGASLTIGGVSAFLQYANRFAKPLNEISSCISELQLGYDSLRRINEILDAQDDVDNGTIVSKKPINEIVFNHVYFDYSKDQKLIQDFNFTIKRGEKIAIVGPTGCGKTTMVNLLLRFYDPIKGEFLFDGINSLEIQKNDLRSNFKMVLQETWVFKGTVYENITYGLNNVDKDKVINACKEANSYDFIMHLPNGFETEISDSSGLSMGEKQLINITRVMLYKPDIVILDEMTSNIDTRSEIKIIDGFLRLMANRTSIVIAHRLSTIVNSNRIIVMKDGHIDDIGTHKELLARKGFYYKLYNSQFE